MKKSILILTITGLAALISLRAQTPPDANNNAPDAATQNNADAAAPAPDAAAVDALPVPSDAPMPGDAATTGTVDERPKVILPTKQFKAREDIQSDFAPPTELGTNVDELRLNFRNAPLEMVLNYLSDAAGFIIVLDTRVNGNVNVMSSHPMTRNEAVDLLNSVLNKNGYAAIRNGRTLTIVETKEAKTRDIPVKTGSEPDSIPNNDEVVTQIIPIRFVEARQLISDLSEFVSSTATVIANEAGNSIVITDTQSNIRHIAKIIKAIDDSAEAETEIRVFHLKYASPTDVATELGSIFPTSNGGGTQSPIRFGGGGAGGGGGGRGAFFAQMMAGAAGGNNDRIKKATQVTAVADARIQSVVVTAPRDLMEQIAGMMKDLDVPSTRDQKVFVFHMDNADPQQAAQVLQTMFQSSNSRNSTSSSQNSALQQRAQNNATSSGSTSSSTSGFGTSGAGGGGRSGSQF